MKSIIQQEKKQAPIPFPKLMISDKGMIVLFEYEHRGIVLYKGNGGSKEFLFQKSFNMTLFTDYFGKVILSND